MDVREAVFRICGWEFSYQEGRRALDQVSLDIFEGEKIAVLGANGAGKSTFFLALNGVLCPDRGETFYRGRLVTKKEWKRLREKVGIVFQDADNQILASPVSAEVSFGPMNLKLPKEEVKDRVEEALEYMNLTAFRDRPPHYLSGGEKKRVSIADILAMKPELFLFDEPTASLDPMNAAALEKLLWKLAEEHKTLLISTHDVDFAYRFADRAVVFSAGRVIADGTPLSVFQNKEVVRMANLKRPVLLEVYEMLLEKGLVPPLAEYPKDSGALRTLLQISHGQGHAWES